MIRLIRPEEVVLLLPQARQFFREGQIDGALNEAHFVGQLTSLMRAGTMFVLADGAPFRGAIAGAVVNDLATGELVGTEYFWYVAREERGSLGVRLLAEFEREAKARGAVRVLMMHHVTPASAKFDHIYGRRGYRLREQLFVKALT
jgi:hypothetical protein